MPSNNANKNKQTDGSVGPVTAQKVVIESPLTLACGIVLPSHTLVYETYGTPNKNNSNAILICHALSGNHHAAGIDSETSKVGWWDHYIGPGKAIDTDKFYVVSVVNIGSCFGSTGPTSVNPETGSVWGADFPPARQRLGRITKTANGAFDIDWGSHHWRQLGRHASYALVSRAPRQVTQCGSHCVIYEADAQNIAFNETARRAIKSDPDFCEGNYLTENRTPAHGLALARMIGHITYLSDELMGQKFGRDLRSGDLVKGKIEPVEFQVESYLNYQGNKFSDYFDANAYILITKMLDYFDLAREYNDDPVAAFSHATCKFFVISFSSDWRFSPQRSAEITDALIAAGKSVSYIKIESDHGHDSFLLPNKRYQDALGSYLSRVAQQLEDSTP